MLKKLFKIQMISAYQTVFFSGGKKTKKLTPVKIVLWTLLVLYVLCSIFFSVTAMLYNMAAGLIPIGLDYLYFAVIAIMAFGMSVTYTIFMCRSLFFEAKDNQLLLSMPIKPSHILGSRLLVLAILDLASSLIFLLPAAGVYVYFKAPPVTFYAYFIIGVLALQLLSITLSSLLGYLVSTISTHVKNKAFFTTGISLILLGGYLWGYTYLTTSMFKMVENGASIGAAIKNNLPPFYYFGDALGSGSITSLLFLIIWCAVPFFSMYFILSKAFIFLSSPQNNRIKKTAYNEGMLRDGGVFSALLKKEFHKFLNTPSYLLNCGLSYLLSVSFGVYFLIKGPDLLELMFADIPRVSAFLIPILILLLSFLAAMSFSTAPSISLEGKNLWILKSIPVKSSTILNAKISMNLILGLSTLLFVDICIITRLSPSLSDALLIILIPFSVQIFVAQEGLICNLLFPKFDATNDTIVVKQSLSVLLSTLISFALIAILVTPYIIFRDSISFSLFGGLTVVFINILSVAAYRLIVTKGVRMFETF